MAKKNAGQAKPTRAQRLKVFRTPIGFHDAYVAAPSQKAALEAWGAQSNLFASGSAERVEAPELTREPLAKPGQVIRRLRATLEEHMAALPKQTKTARDQRRLSPRAGQSTSAPVPKPKPRPQRDALERAEAALAELASRQTKAQAELARKQAELDREWRALQARQQRERAKLRKRAEAAREKYEKALEALRNG